jgi:hypothetical protein
LSAEGLANVSFRLPAATALRLAEGTVTITAKVGVTQTAVFPIRINRPSLAVVDFLLSTGFLV